MRVFESNGILLRAQQELFVDASGIRGKNALITHAHSDHSKTHSANNYFLTPETSALIKSSSKPLSLMEIPFGKKFCVNDFDCCFHLSGHILGSAQLEVHNGADLVITSDFKLQDSILFKGAEILPSEILVIETTFGLPEYSFPRREDVYAEIVKWVSARIKENSFVVLGGYSTGKAQELTKIMNEFLGIAPLVYKKVFLQNKVYESHGAKLGNYIELNHNLSDSSVLIMPPHLIDNNLVSALSHQIGKKVEAAIATGWANHSRFRTFPLSDHADFSSLVNYVRESNPKLVLTTHGYEEEFAGYVQKRLGIPARPLSKEAQATLGEFIK